MKKVLVLTLFLLVSMAWAVAQTHDPAAQGQASSPSPTVNDSGQQTSPPPGQSTTPGQSGQSAPGMPSSSGQMPGQAAPPSDQSPMANMTVTEGCLGGTAPNFTITDKAGVVYKLNIPAATDTSVLTKHVGESVQVAGQVNGAGSGATASSSGASSSSGGASIDAKKIGRGTGTCPGSATGGKTPTPPAK
jgi:hypothetical protein